VIESITLKENIIIVQWKQTCVVITWRHYERGTMSEPVRILIVEDAPTDFELAQREIRKAVNDCVFQQVQTRQDFLGALETFQPDLILSDYQMPSFDGMAALQLTQVHAKLTPFIIWTGTMSEDVAVE